MGNNPVNFVDPTGHEATPWQKAGLDFMKEVFKHFPGFKPNTTVVDTSTGPRIFDFFNSQVWGEIKNVAYQHLSSQIRGMIQKAVQDGKTFVLVVSETTKLSKPLLEALQKAGGVLIRYGPKGLDSVPMFVPKQWLEDGMKQFDPLIIITGDIVDDEDAQEILGTGGASTSSPDTGGGGGEIIGGEMMVPQ